jgi:hypothetical protein
MPLSTPPATLPTSPTSPRQVVLGLFILGQLAFLPLAVLLAFYQDSQPYMPAEIGAALDPIVPGFTAKTGHAWEVPDEVATALRRWSQLTGQEQRWALFAPGVYKVTGFPALVLDWEAEPRSAPAIARGVALLGASDACSAVGIEIAMRHGSAPVIPPTDTFLSDNEPADRYCFVRMGMFRFRRYESSLVLYLTQRDGESAAEAHERWSESIRDHVARNNDVLHTYLKWRLEAYRSRHPTKPVPQQVILVERAYPILPPEDDSGACWKGPETHPLARWQPGVTWQPEYRPVERYNPVTERFESLVR